MKKQTTQSSKVVIVPPPVKGAQDPVSIKSELGEFGGTEETAENDGLSGDTPVE